MPSDNPATVTVPRLMEAREAASVLGCSERLVWRLAALGELRCVHIRRLRRFDLADCLAYIERNKVGGQ